MIQVGVRHRERESGFTLVELLVAMVISLVVMAAIYSTYHSQQKSYLVQEQVAAMQQNLRSAMYNMAREVRMAGYDPTGGSEAGIQDMGWNDSEERYTSIQMSMDITDDAGTGDPDGDTDDANEDITYSLVGADLMRNNQTIAENIDALDFVYLDGDGSVTANLSDIRSIEVSIVARTGRGDRGYTNIMTYNNLRDLPIYTANDNFRRRLLTCEIKSRNLGLGL